MSWFRAVLRRGQQGVGALPSWAPYALAVVGIVLLLALVLAGFRLARPGVLPGVALDGEDVGGLDRDALVAVVEAHAEEHADAELVVEARLDDDGGGEPAAREEGDEDEGEDDPGGQGGDEDEGEDDPDDADGSAAAGDDGDDRQWRSTRAALGDRLDVDGTAERVWRRGRQLNPVAALWDHLRAFGDGIDLEPLVATDGDALAAWVDEAADALDAEPDEGGLRIEGTEVETTVPSPGLEVDREALAEAAAEVAGTRGAARVEAPAEELPTRSDPDELEALAADAERAVSGAVRLTRDEAALELAPEEIGALLEVEEERDDDAVRRRLAADADALDALVDDDLRAALETEPEDAVIRVSGGAVEIHEHVDGFSFDAEVAAEQLVAVATDEEGGDDNPREDELDGEIVEPDLTTEGAEELGITEQIASFTTEHACCQGRVQNIQRMADLIDHTLVEPGETFSINDHVGPRTREGGFTDGGVIIGGEFEQAVGGGVSQFATTFFNAIFFAGYEILDHQPHSYYISRYPVGREATLNYPNLDVAFRNDSPHGALLVTSYTPTSITVSVWGTEWADVEARTGQRRNVTSPPVEHEENASLEPGSERVVQSGRQGFTVSYTRVIDYHDGGTDEQTWTHTYRAEPRIIERNTSEPEEDEDDGEDDDDDDGEGGDDDADDGDNGDNGDDDDGDDGDEG